MLKNLCYSVALAAGLCAPSMMAWANDANTEQNQAKSVIVSGTGSTRELALNNAFRHAVEQAVGMMVSSESYVKNLKEIEDKIIVDSSGFIENYKILKEGRMSNEYGITLSAVVRERKLQAAVTETTGSTQALNGKSLFANQMLREDKIKQYEKTYVEAMDDFISNGVEYSYDGEPEIKKQNNGLYTITLKGYKAQIKKEWLQNLDKYRSIFVDESIYNEASIDDSYQPTLSLSARTIILLNDSAGKKIYEHKTNTFSSPRTPTRVEFIFGLFDHSDFRYPNFSDDRRTLNPYDQSIENLSSDLVAQISSVSFKTVKTSEYFSDPKMPRGRLQVYKPK